MRHPIIFAVIYILLIASLIVSAWGGAVSIPERAKADLIIIEKKAHLLSLLVQGRVLKTYQIALGHNPDGAKLQEGDGRTPEGVYYICGRNSKSRYHRSLRLSYPAPEDKRRAKELGVDPGGDIMIHGISKRLGWVGERHRLFDWTNGCIAVTNEEIEEIWRMVADGTAVEIRP